MKVSHPLRTNNKKYYMLRFLVLYYIMCSKYLTFNIYRMCLVMSRFLSIAYLEDSRFAVVVVVLFYFFHACIIYIYIVSYYIYLFILVLG